MGKIRPAKEKDTKKIIEMINSSENFNGGNGGGDRWTIKDVKETLKFPIYKVFVLEKDKKIISAMILEIHTLSNNLYIYVLVVDKKLRGKGIGKKMMKFAEDFAKKKKITFLWALTEQHNYPMKRLLSKNKFKRGKKFYFYSKDL